MKAVREYLRHAEECDALAQKATSPEQRQMIADMSNTWRMLADQRWGRILKAQREALGFDPLPPAAVTAEDDTKMSDTGSDR